MTSTRILFSAVAGVLAFAAANTSSFALDLELNTPFNGQEPTSQKPWLAVVFTQDDIMPTRVKVQLTASLEVGSEYFGEFAFNVAPMFQTLLFTGLPEGWDATFGQDLQMLPGGGVAGQGFDVVINLPNANNNIDGAERFDGSDTATFYLDTFPPDGLTPASFDLVNASGIKFGAHVLGIPQGTGSGAIKDGPSEGPTPEVPDVASTIMLLGCALTLMGLFGKRFSVETWLAFH